MGNCLPASADSKIFAARIIKRKDYQDKREREKQEGRRIPRVKMHNRALSFRTVSARLRKNNNQPARCFLRTKEAGKPLTRLWSGVAMFPLVVSFFSLLCFFLLLFLLFFFFL